MAKYFTLYIYEASEKVILENWKNCTAIIARLGSI